LGGIAVVGFLLVGVGGYFWFKKYGDSFMTSTKELAQQGFEFGRGRPPEDCVAESVRQVKDCAPINLKCTMKGQMFIQACLRSAAVPETFCQDVPARTSILDSISYRKEQCERLGQGSKDQCSQIMQGVQLFCEARRNKKPEAK
jgi:hypothetical protein